MSISLILLISYCLLLPLSLSVNQEGLFLLHFKSPLIDPSNALSDWNPRHPSPCNWTGVSCSDGDVSSLNLFNYNLSGTSDPSSLCRLPNLTSLSLAFNYIHSSVGSFASCTSLAYLDLSMNNLNGSLPSSLATLPYLVHLDLSGNSFAGEIPSSFGSFSKLENLSLYNNYITGPVPPFLGNISSLRRLDLAYNQLEGPVPEELGNLTSLENLWLANCTLIGSIPSSLGKLTNLKNLDLSRNKLTGPIPDSIFRLSRAYQILLYENSLSGDLPRGMSNLTSLRNLDFHGNQLAGTLPGELFNHPSLESLHLYENSFVGSLPVSVAGAKKLFELRLFKNKLTGTVPFDLGMSSPLKVADLSQNYFTGEIPREICNMGKLEQLMMIENQLSGTIPEGLGRCFSLQRLRLSTNCLSGVVPQGLWGLPGIYMIDLAKNSLSGSISSQISQGTNISTLLLFDNDFDGILPLGIGSLKKLQKLSASSNRLHGPLPASLVELSALENIDFNNNSISGELPQEVKKWVRLTELNFASNKLTGPIPMGLGDLPVLTSLDLSNNHLTGEVPSSLQNLKLNVFNLSNNELSGVPSIFSSASYREAFLGNPGLCSQIPGLCPTSHRKNPSSMWVLRAIFVLAGLVLVLGMARVYWRYRTFRKARRNMSKWTLTSFHKLGFSEEEIVEGVSEENLIGSGASGKVYKVELSSGDTVAVKVLQGMWKKAYGEDEGNADSEIGGCGDYGFEMEVSMLGSIRHKNIVRLWCSCAHKNCRLLVYEFMPNGSLSDVLHGGGKKGVLNWETRYQIAVDTAEGLSYLHHDCSPQVIHRDVKTSNILLDAHFHARLSDFGIAKAVVGDGSQTKSLSRIAGTCGYLAPEYAYTLRVNEKSDIYSFGVVLLELVTGKPAIDPEFEEKDLVKWVIYTLDKKGIDHVVDQNLDNSFGEEICKVLDIGLQCTDSLPLTRPSMQKVVKMLHEVRTCNGKSKNEKKQQDQNLSPYYFEDVEEDCIAKEK